MSLREGIMCLENLYNQHLSYSIYSTCGFNVNSDLKRRFALVSGWLMGMAILYKLS